MEYAKCLETKSTENGCDRAPSECTYCCKGDSKCNAYNSAENVNIQLNKFPTCAIIAIISSYVNIARFLHFDIGLNIS